jgi:hypothetical protein
MKDNKDDLVALAAQKIKKILGEIVDDTIRVEVLFLAGYCHYCGKNKFKGHGCNCGR